MEVPSAAVESLHSKVAKLESAYDFAQPQLFTMQSCFLPRSPYAMHIFVVFEAESQRRQKVEGFFGDIQSCLVDHSLRIGSV